MLKPARSAVPFGRQPAGHPRFIVGSSNEPTRCYPGPFPTGFPPALTACHSYPSPSTFAEADGDDSQRVHMTIGQSPGEGLSDIAAASEFVSQSQWNVPTFARKVRSMSILQPTPRYSPPRLIRQCRMRNCRRGGSSPATHRHRQSVTSYTRQANHVLPQEVERDGEQNDVLHQEGHVARHRREASCGEVPALRHERNDGDRRDEGAS